jgi:hypothetical protein
VISYVQLPIYECAVLGAAVCMVPLQVTISTSQHYCASVPGDVVWLLTRLLPDNVVGARFMVMHLLSSRWVVWLICLCVYLCLYACVCTCVYTCNFSTASSEWQLRSCTCSAAGEFLLHTCVAFT